MMTNLQVGGVPEHFNLPWHLALEAGSFKSAGIHLSWENYSTGTGDMVKALAANELDVAIVLTEGIVNAINQGNPAKVIGGYVASPLLWGIHVNAQSSFMNESDLQSAKVGISRFGSGSHLMAAYYFQKQGRVLQEDDYVIVDNLDGARDALGKNLNLVFFWEQFTTQWLVNGREFKRISVCPTPWPCFMIAASPKSMVEKRQALGEMLKVIRNEIQLMLNNSDLVNLLSDKYRMSQAETIQWLNTVNWDTAESLNLPDILDQTQRTLCHVGLIKNIFEPSFYLFTP